MKNSGHDLFRGGCPMKGQSAIGLALLALGLGGSCLGAEGQKAVVIHAGQLFDGKSDRLLGNQVIVIQGDRIVEVGPAGSVKIPAGAADLDLGPGTPWPERWFPRDMSRSGLRGMQSWTSSRALPRRAICRAAGRWT